ncbi:hypothetical protein RUM44_000881 [Polyplax serrata]|uniref:Brf1 TBP-binding domain-containing protein n=1 Tax=Polyplax serrata TaxID=468196 RepID=A0ABR1B7D2_POLSC
MAVEHLGFAIPLQYPYGFLFNYRLLEFGETPSSSLSLDEFMTVDLEEEQDPPSFKAARKKDHHDRFQKIIEGEEIGQNLTALQMEIEKELKEISSKKKSSLKVSNILGTEDESESQALNSFVHNSTIRAIEECITRPGETETETAMEGQGLPPSFSTLGLNTECLSTSVNDSSPGNVSDGELVTDDLDDEELNQYIMTDREAKFKDTLWMKINEDYLQQQKEREAKLAKEKEEGKPEKKRKKYSSKKSKNGPAANTAGEAFEKMLQEKKMSTKINYDVLKSLSLLNVEKIKEETTFKRMKMSDVREENTVKSSGKEIVEEAAAKESEPKETEGDASGLVDDGDGEEDMDEIEVDATTDAISLSQLLNRHGNPEAEDYGDEYDDEIEDDY